MSAQIVQEPGVELGEVQVNDMGPMRHLYRISSDGILRPGDVAACGAIYKGSARPATRERPPRVCRVCDRAADLMGVGR